MSITLAKVPRALIDVLDAEGAISGHEIEYHFVYEGADAPPPKVVRESASAETISQYRSSAHDALVASNNALNQRIADERATHATALSETNAAHAQEVAAKDARLVELEALIAEAMAE